MPCADWMNGQCHVHGDPGDLEPNCRIQETHGSSSVQDPDTRRPPWALRVYSADARNAAGILAGPSFVHKEQELMLREADINIVSAGIKEASCVWLAA